jgi:2-polyprenyl-3-methyl-5-hydroxy-6-metoxy-1,4-benzoquinol methylase
MSSELTDLDAVTRTAGDRDTAAASLWDVGAVVAGAVPIETGMGVLDVATGAGGVAIRAARAGAEVVGLDMSAQQLEGAARPADTEGVRVEWVEGDPEALSYDDDSFDRVLSAFGVSFATAPTTRRASSSASAVPGARS